MTNPAFWDNIAAKYASRDVSDPMAYEATLDHVRTFLKASDKVLEIGCGTGSTALALAPSVAYMTATDISAEMLKIAQEKLGVTTMDNVGFVRVDAETATPGAPFDAACAFNVLHLVDDLPTTLRHLHSQVKPGGLVISKTPCFKDMAVFVRMIIPVMRLFKKAPPILQFGITELESAFHAAGFTITESRHFGKHRAHRFMVARRN